MNPPNKFHINGSVTKPVLKSFLGIFVLLLSLSVAPVAEGQSGRDSNSLVFQIDPMLSFSGFDGFKVSYLNHSSSDRYWRIGATFNFGYEYRTFDGSEDRLAPDSRSYDLFVRVHYDRIFTINPQKSISFYSGGGPRIGLGFFNENDDGVLVSFQEDALMFDMGAGIVAGVEWRILNMLSLYGEYGLNLMYFSHKTEMKTSEFGVMIIDTFRTNGVELFGTGARIGVILRF